MGELDKNMDEGLEFDVIQETYDPASHSKRNLAAFEVKPTGASASNVESGEAFVKWLQKHYGDAVDPYRCSLLFGANVKKGLVALYISETAVEGATAARWADDRKTFSFHLGAVFRKYPQLRPSTTVEALFRDTTDKDGKPCLAISLKGALAKRKGPVDPAEKALKQAARRRKRTAPAGAEAVAAAEEPKEAK